jgi:hypothetical protein
MGVSALLLARRYHHPGLCVHPMALPRDSMLRPIGKRIERRYAPAAA